MSTSEGTFLCAGQKKIHKSGAQEGTMCPPVGPLLAPLSFNPLRQIECSEAGCVEHYPARASRSPVLRFLIAA